MESLTEELINITKGATSEEVIEIAHNSTAEPSLWIAWFGFIGILLISALLFKEKRGWGKFWQIFGVTAFLSLVLILFLANAPNFVQEVAEFFSTLIK